MAVKSSEDVLERLSSRLLSQLQGEIRQGFAESSAQIVEEVKKLLSTDTFVPHAAVPIVKEEGNLFSNKASDSQTETQRRDDEKNESPMSPVRSLRKLSSSQGLDRHKQEIAKAVAQSQEHFAHSIHHLLQVMRDRHDICQEREHQFLYRFVSSWAFSVFCMSMILANSVWIGYESDNRKVAGSGWLKTVNLTFTTWFVFECILKLLAFRYEFFVGPDYKWNILDLLLVLTSIPEYVSNSVRFSIIRMLRLARLTRTFRVIRLLKYLHSLREIVFSLAHTLSSLFWCFVAMLLATYIWALLFIQFLDLQWDDELLQARGMHFKSVRFTMTALYCLAFGGDDWYPFYIDFEHHGAYLTQITLLAYVFFMNFGLVNVVIGVFCARANEASQENKELRMNKEHERHERMVNDLVSVFNMIDVHRLGVIGWEQFLVFANNPETLAILNTYGVPSFAVDKVWRIMDECDGKADGQVTLTSFVMALMRLSTHSISTELMLMSNQVLEIRSAMKDIVQHVSGFGPAPSRGQSCEQRLLPL